jgi:hypothetical protein
LVGPTCHVRSDDLRNLIPTRAGCFIFPRFSAAIFPANVTIPTAHKRNEKGGTQNRQQSPGEMQWRKFKGQPELPLDEKTSMNDGKHHRNTKAIMNLEKP